MADCDIYFSMNVVPEPFRKACLLHEIVEVVIISIYGSPIEEAHNVAEYYDDMYARETLSGEQYREYSLLRGKLLE